MTRAAVVQRHQRRAQREAHAEAADQHFDIWFCPRAPVAASVASASSEPLRREFISVLVADHDGKFGSALHQPHLAASAGHVGRVEQGPGNHGSLFSPTWAVGRYRFFFFLAKIAFQLSL